MQTHDESTAALPLAGSTPGAFFSAESRQVWSANPMQDEVKKVNKDNDISRESQVTPRRKPLAVIMVLA
jgi:hypothetical protein